MLLGFFPRRGRRAALHAQLCRLGALCFASGVAGLLRLLFSAVGCGCVHLSRGADALLEDLLIVLVVPLTLPVSTQKLVRAAATHRTPQCSSATGEAPTEPIGRVDGSRPLVARAGSG